LARTAYFVAFAFVTTQLATQSKLLGSTSIIFLEKNQIRSLLLVATRWREEMKYASKKIALLAIGAAMATWGVNATAGNPDNRKLAKPAPPAAMGNPDNRTASASAPAPADTAAMGNPDNRKAAAPAPEEPAATMGTPDQRTPAPK
jgi:hypothetical protein